MMVRDKADILERFIDAIPHNLPLIVTLILIIRPILPFTNNPFALWKRMTKNKRLHHQLSVCPVTIFCATLILLAQKKTRFN